VELDSTYATAYYNLGGVLENMGKYNDAANAYNDYLKFADTPQDSQNVLVKIQILKAAGKYR
jgi:tetratricopeptide (TPR) repeat protein